MMIRGLEITEVAKQNRAEYIERWVCIQDPSDLENDAKRFDIAKYDCDNFVKVMQAWQVVAELVTFEEAFGFVMSTIMNNGENNAE